MRFIYTKPFAIFVTLLVSAAILTFFHSKGWLDPIQRAFLHIPRPIIYVVDRFSRPIKSFFINAYNLKQIANENAQLQSKVYSLQNRQVLFDELTRENDQLKKELQFVKASKLILQPCTVIGRSPVGIVDAITINCGQVEGAEVGHAVTSKGFLVGKITYVSKDFATAQLITNASFSTDAKLSQSGRLAVVRGSFNSGLILDQISQDEILQKGMLAVTAGVNEKIPKNILIGEIGEILSGPNDLFKKATLISPVDFGGLEFVFLVK